MLDNAKWVGCFDEEAPLIRGKFELKDTPVTVSLRQVRQCAFLTQKNFTENG